MSEINRFQDIVAELRGSLAPSVDSSQKSPLSEQDLDTIERTLRYRLPEDYREFVRDYGGFWFNFGAIYPLTSRNGLQRVASVEIFYGWMPGRIGRDLLETYSDTFEQYEDVMPPYLLPIGSDAGSNDTCLDLSPEGHGKVYFWKRGCAMPEELDFVAPSFTEFMSLLRNDLP